MIDGLIWIQIWQLDYLQPIFKQYITKIAALAMNLIALKHFKSYQEQLLNNLNPHINLIIGRNGEGKSNFFRAINFLVTDRVHFAKNEYFSYLHRAIDNVQHPIAVEAYYRNQSTSNGAQANIFRIERIWKDENTEEFRIDDRVFSRSEFQNFLESLGLTYYNSYNVIQQGKINQVALMDEVEIYRMLQEATGIHKFEKRHENTLAELKKNEEQKEEIKVVLNDIEARLKAYEDRREEFEYYSYEQLANKARSKQDYEQDVKKFERQLQELKDKQTSSSEEVIKLRVKVNDLKAELEQINGQMAVNQKQMLDFAIEPQFHSQEAPSTQSEKTLSSELKKIKKAKDQLKVEFNKKNSKVEQFRQQLKPHKDKFQAMTALLQTEKMMKLGKDKGKVEIREWLTNAIDTIKQINAQLAKLHKHKAQYKIAPNNRQEQDLSSARKELQQLNKDMRTLKIRTFQNNRLKNQYESQVDIASRMAETHYARLRKVLPLLDFGLLKQIRKANLEGVYGFMVEFVQIQPTVAFAYQIAGLQKLCSLLVRDESVCGRVVQLNKKLKGRQVNILPVSFVLRQAIEKKNYPSVDDCYSLLNQQWIKVKPHKLGEEFDRGIRKIIMNSFHKHVLVKDYDLGLTVSKQYHLNCITADREIVYSQGYLCKVGKDGNVDDRIQIYTRYSQKIVQMEQANEKLQQSSKEGMILQNQEMELMRLKYQREANLSTAQQKLEHAVEQKKSIDRLSEQEKQLEQKLSRFQEEVKKKEEMLANIQNKKAIKVNPKEYESAEEAYNSKMKVFNQLCEEECSLEVRLAELAKQEEGLTQKLATVQQQLQIKQEVKKQMSDEQKYKQRVADQAKRLAEARQQLQKQISNSEQQLADRQAENYQVVGTTALLQEQVIFCTTKLAQIGAIDISLEQIEQKSNSFSLSRNFDRRDKPAIVTTREKLMFSKLSNYVARCQEERQRYQELLQNEAKLVQLLTRYDLDKEQCLSRMYAVFEKEFDRIFKRVTGRGTTDVRLKKIADKSRGFLKYKHSISIMVSFDGQDATRKWKDFSGGQRTVLAICLLMALQKCEPAPFYVLDEIDAALDPIYLDRIVQLIRQESQRSQYFITSFKKEMLAFPESICNYYLVEATDRVSSIRRVSQEAAQQVVERIVS